MILQFWCKKCELKFFTEEDYLKHECKGEKKMTQSATNKVQCKHCGTIWENPELQPPIYTEICFHMLEKHSFKLSLDSLNEHILLIIDNDCEYQFFKTEEKINFKHTSSTKIPHFELIPLNALIALANRFQLGKEKYKDKAWDVLNPNQEGLKDEDWIIARASHIIYHAYKYIAKLRGLIPEDNDDDAGAIMWGGCCLSEAKRVKKES